MLSEKISVSIAPHTMGGNLNPIFSLQRSASDVRHNCRIKSYPSGLVEVCAASSQLFREPGWEIPRKQLHVATAEQERAYHAAVADPDRESDILSDDEEALYRDTPTDPAESLDRARRRARSAVHSLALANEWSYFVTLTLDASKVDRYDMGAITRKLNVWLDNHVRRDGLRYVLVPERHKDGAVHFHGFFNDALRAIDSGAISPCGGGRPRRPRSLPERERLIAAGGHVIFNLPQWTFGFTTAIALYGNRQAAVGYVCKYVTKQEGKIGGRWYYSGGLLQQPDVSFADVNLEDLAAAPGSNQFCVPQLPGVRFVQLTLQETCDVNQNPPQGCPPSGAG